MYVHRRKGWEVSENQVTSETAYETRPKGGLKMSRRHLIGSVFAGGAAAFTARGLGLGQAMAATNLENVSKNETYKVARSLTKESLATSYCNFYEFGSHKNISKAAQQLKTSPWKVQIDGLVEQEKTIDFEDILKEMPLEERIYRHRCVEAWAMTVPWTGFPLAALMAYLKPLSSAKYVRFETFKDSEMASGQRQFWYPWPYVEGITVAEAQNDMAFIATGIYGKTLPKQNGAPLRLVLPWKYGFKSIKSITRITLTDERPVSFWEEIQNKEYGFWANVNPEVPHPRWTQAEERLLGEDGKVPTRLFNGYGEFVADLYKDMSGEILYR